MIKRTDPNDRRKSERFELEVLVNYSKEAQAVTRNFSLDGLSIITDESFQVDIFLNLLFTLPDGHPINSIGRVIWCKGLHGKYVSGIEFMSIKKEDRAILEEYARSCEAERRSAMQED